jgi:glycosyltransferase involved in cell wall biosynthesis
MNILMMTNTYLPQVGGVSLSVAGFAEEYRRRGHRVVIVAPEYEEAEGDEEDLIRIPAIQHFNGSDFSVMLPVPGFLDSHLKDFGPDLIHSHHPFLVGSTAVRLSRRDNIPLVYTHHTMFEQYLHYTPVRASRMKGFVVELATGYANLADLVIAPSDSVAGVLKQQGVHVPIDIIPTGVRPEQFAQGDGASFRASQGIASDAFVVGHIGRLAPEKNLLFLAQAVAAFLKDCPPARFLLVGYGPSEKDMAKVLAAEGVGDRLHFAGKQTGQQLIDAYHAMDLFAFSSKSETQGMVLAEAMAAGTPVVGLDASGVREVLEDGHNGYLVQEEQANRFAAALTRYYRLESTEKDRMHSAARRTAKGLSLSHCAERALADYERLLAKKPGKRTERDDSIWRRAAVEIRAEWDLVQNIADAARRTLR